MPTSRFAALGLVAASLAVPATSRAQEAHAKGGVDIVAGLEGGGTGYAKGVRRSRSLLRFGTEVWVDEDPKHQVALGALVELEPVASFGADLRYQLRASDSSVFHAGATSVIAPKYMLGATFGFGYRLAVTDTVELNFNPVANVYFWGSDLPKDTVLWQAMLGVGARVDLF
ncbi:MAG: hypothetical protein EXR75_11035 [Myxococcales bacterium]|nr:hypothetical protein [Myxococcales bacterium]